MITIIIVIVFLVYFFRRDEGKEDEIIAILKQIRDEDIVNPLVGGRNATEKSETSEEKTNKTSR